MKIPKFKFLGLKVEMSRVQMSPNFISGINKGTMTEQRNMTVNSVIFLPMTKADFESIKEEFTRRLSHINVKSVESVLVRIASFKDILVLCIKTKTNIHAKYVTRHSLTL